MTEATLYALMLLAAGVFVFVFCTFGLGVNPEKVLPYLYVFLVLVMGVFLVFGP